MTAPTGRLDPDELARLEEERDFLLRSIDDLDRELEAGDLDEADHASLHDDYTARAAELIRAIDGRKEALRSATPPVPIGRRLLVLGAVALAAVLAVVFLFQVAEDRRAGDPLTGDDLQGADPETAASPGGEGAPEEDGGEGNGGCMALMSTDTEAAIECFDELLAEDPADAEALAYRGWVLHLDGRTEEAMADLDASVAADPTFPDVRVFRAAAFADQEDYGAADAELDVFFSLDPSPEMASYVYEEGLAEAVGVGLLDPRVAGCWEHSVAAFSTGADLTGSLGCFDDVVAEQPTSAEARTAKAYVLMILASSSEDEEPELAALLFEDARTELVDAITIDPDAPDAHLLLAAVADSTGDHTAAIAELDLLASLAPPSHLYWSIDPAQIREAASAALATD